MPKRKILSASPIMVLVRPLKEMATASCPSPAVAALIDPPQWANACCIGAEPSALRGPPAKASPHRSGAFPPMLGSPNARQARRLAHARRFQCHLPFTRGSQYALPRLRHKPLAARRTFSSHALAQCRRRERAHSAALGLGVLGYHSFAGLPWVDALLNAAMILTGMGPVSPLPTARPSCSHLPMLCSAASRFSLLSRCSSVRWPSACCIASISSSMRAQSRRRNRQSCADGRRPHLPNPSKSIRASSRRRSFCCVGVCARSALMDDRRFPWLVLVPERPGLRDFTIGERGSGRPSRKKLTRASRLLSQS